MLDAEVTRQREALALQRQQLSRVERVSQRTHSSLYLRLRVVQELARKVHRLLRCLDMLAVKLRARSILVGTELALDDGVVLRNLQRRCGGGSADAAESPVRLLWRVLEGAYQAELGVDAAREQRQCQALRNAVSKVHVELLRGVYYGPPPPADAEAKLFGRYCNSTLHKHNKPDSGCGLCIRVPDAALQTLMRAGGSKRRESSPQHPFALSKFSECTSSSLEYVSARAARGQSNSL